MNLREAALLTLASASRSGATECEVVAIEGDSLEVGTRLAEVEKVKRAHDRRVALRVFTGKSSAVCSTADLTPGSLRGVAEDCVALSRETASDPWAGLPETADPDPSIDLDLFDPRCETISAEQAIETCKLAERAALDFDPRIKNSEGAECRLGSYASFYATSSAQELDHRASFFSLSVVPVASAGDGMQRDGWSTSARHFEDLESPEDVGRTAAARALRRLGPRPIKTSEVPVIFDPDSAASLLGHLAAAVSGTSLYRGTSFLERRRGERIAPEFVTIIDDGRLPRRLGSRAFDADGLATRRNVVIGEGVLRSYLLDTYSARKLGLSSTGNAVRTFGEAPSAGASNFYLEARSSPPAEIIESVSEGLYVTELVGFGVNPVTGDYSRGASGLWIENGAFAFPVEEITVAGNLLTMFSSIEAVGNDLRFRGTISAPTIKISHLTVAAPS